MKATKSPDTGLVHVEFDWSDEHGECLDCGLPAAYEIPNMYGPGTTTERFCAICAAQHVADGDTDTLIYLFET